MGSSTTNLSLYKTNMLTDGNDEFDFKRDLDDNWDKIDARFGYIDVQIAENAWMGSEAPYSQEVNIEGMTANINPSASLVYSSDYQTAQTERAEYSKIFKGVTSSGKITFYATSPTGCPLTLRIKKL